MSVAGLCQICQTARADHRCGRCGTLACTEHYERGRALCIECAGETQSGESRF